MALDEKHGEAILQLDLLRSGQRELRQNSRFGSVLAPRLVRHAAGNGDFLFGLGRLRNILDLLLALDCVDDDALIVLQMLRSKLVDRVDGRTVVALQVLGQISGILQIMVVAI